MNIYCFAEYPTLSVPPLQTGPRPVSAGSTRQQQQKSKAEEKQVKGKQV
jgi:hypothetical protein